MMHLSLALKVLPSGMLPLLIWDKPPPLIPALALAKSFMMGERPPWQLLEAQLVAMTALACAA